MHLESTVKQIFIIVTNMSQLPNFNNVPTYYNLNHNLSLNLVNVNKPN